MFRHVRVIAALVVWDATCLIMGYDVYTTMTLLLAIYLILELVALCAEAEVRTQLGLRGKEPKWQNTSQCRWWDERIGISRFYKTDQKLRASFGWWMRWLPARVLWRITLWTYFW